MDNDSICVWVGCKNKEMRKSWGLCWKHLFILPFNIIVFAYETFVASGFLMKLKQYLMRVVFPVSIVVKYIPFGKNIAWRVYCLLTPDSERWVDVHGASLLTNIHDNGIGTGLYLTGKYAMGRIAEIMSAVKEGDTVIDIGANIGYFTVLLAKLVGEKGRVYAFEPDPRNFELLKRTIKQNNFTQVIAEQFAVSNRNGEVSFYQTKSWAANTLNREYNLPSVEVDVVSLDVYLFIERNIRFVKIDTDGSEILAIQGMQNLIKQSPNIRILAEYQPSNLKRYLANPLDFIPLAEKCGLKLTAIMDSEKGRLPNLDLTPLRHLKDNDNLDIIFDKELL